MSKKWIIAAAVAVAASGVAQADHVSTLHTTPVIDQKSTLQCWAVAATARFDVAASEAAGHLIQLSPRYAFYTKTLGEVVELLMHKKFVLHQGSLCEGCPPEPVYYEQGGVYADAVEAAKVFGVMPESAYPGFPANDLSLFRELNGLVAKYVSQGSEPNRQELIGRVTAVLNRHLGIPPRTFWFEGSEFDARRFFSAALPGWESAPALELNYSPRGPEGQTAVEAYDGVSYPAYSTADQARIMNLLDRSMRAHKAVLLQYKVIDEERTQRNGHIGFAVHGLTPPDHIDWDSAEILDHYVLAIGARYSDDGRLLAVYVKNTWGTSPRDNFGFHWLEADYFPLLEGVEVAPGLEP